MVALNKRQTQILTIMEDGREYTTEAIAGIIGLKGPRTRQLLNELVELGKVESFGTTKDRRYRKKQEFRWDQKMNDKNCMFDSGEKMTEK